jgi:hypothetical protein
MRNLTDENREQIENAYRRMAEEGKYRPAGPSDGFGNQTAESEDELDLDQEAADFAERWWEQENKGEYRIGSVSQQYRPALIFAVGASEIIAGAGGMGHAARLLRMAADELDAAG